MERYDKSWMDRVRDAFRDNLLMRSGVVTIVALIAALGVIVWLVNAHLNGTLQKAVAVKYVPDKSVGFRLGGLELVRMTRLPMIGNQNPEFLTAVYAPGLGMQLLQSTINVPSRGEVGILQNTGMDPGGLATLNASGTPIVVLSAGKTDGKWDTAVDLLRNRPADRVTSTSMPDGGGSEVLFVGIPKAGRTNDNGVQTNISTTLTGHALDLNVTARNVVDEPRSVTIRWEPRFTFPNGGVGSLMLIPPMSEGSSTTLPPVALGARDLNTYYSKFKHGYLGNGPDAQLRNDADGYILHMVALSPSIKSLHAQAAQNGDAALLAFSTTGAPGGDEPTILKPGESLQLHIRLEVTAIGSGYPR